VEAQKIQNLECVDILPVLQQRRVIAYYF